VFDLSERARAELTHFFVAAVAFEKKELKVLGWDGPHEALALVHKSLLIDAGSEGAQSRS
jgi:inorganic pyrophosphatase